MGIRRALEASIDIVFPVECIGCRLEGTWLCFGCAGSIPIVDVLCPGCKQPTLHGECCRACRSEWTLHGIVAVASYQDAVIARGVQVSKYQFSYQIAEALGDFFALRLKKAAPSPATAFEVWRTRMAELPHPALKNNALIIPVPLAPRRLRWRGFNQSQSLAYRVAELYNLPLDTQSLQRQRYRHPQTGLSADSRWRNVANSFVWHGNPLAGRAVTLVDDVVTTGATFEAAARALKAAGAGEVWGVALARG